MRPLFKQGKAAFFETDRMLFRLTIVIINTGLWTAIFAILDLAMSAGFPGTFLFALFDQPLCSVYMNTFLGNLNARHYIKGKPADWSLFINSDHDPNASSARNINLGPLSSRSRMDRNFGEVRGDSLAIRVETHH
ncbi:hypothetical protein M422DRAFT_242229 [Sphaerobolus stellatus SS14]|nr:hypothetical protein M422DRAFT_242229 [Sphaerobolus stellatus SS14]